MSPDHPTALYRREEPICFLVSVLRDGEPVSDGVVDYVLSARGHSLSTGKIELRDVGDQIRQQLKEPGFLHCKVSYRTPHGESVNAIAAAAVEPSQIKWQSPSPDNFWTFWEQQKQRLAQVTEPAKLQEVLSFERGIETFDIQLKSVDSMVSGFFSKPIDARPESLPAVLRLHGAGVGSASRSQSIRGAKWGMLSLDINAHGIANERTRRYYDELAAGVLDRYQYQGSESRDNCYFLNMYLRALRAADFLVQQPEWDRRTLIVYGNSQGGAQALAVAGLDQRVSMVAAGVPALASQSGPVRGWPQFGRQGDGLDTLAEETARYFDVVHFAPGIRAEAMFSVGFLDEVCPPSSVYMAYNQVPGIKKIVNMPTVGHAAPREMQDAFVEAFLKHAHRDKTGVVAD